MMILHFVTVVLLGVAFPAAALDGPAEDEALKPLYFRFETKTDTVHSVPLRVEASTEEGKLYDRVMADRSGDGEFEKSINIESDRSPTPGWVNLTFPLELGGQEWRVDLRGSASDPFARPFHINWTGRGKEVYAWFINGTAKPHATAGEAAEATAVRLGPPFYYQVRSTTRGPNALISVGLVDSNGATMRLAGGTKGGPHAGTESNISLTLSQGGEERSTVSAEYG